MQDFLINQSVISNLLSIDKTTLIRPNNLGKDLLQAIGNLGHKPITKVTKANDGLQLPDTFWMLHFWY